ncbi:MAG TPA: efflux RND transporter periplasmic adaptor subunit [Verrucomicrobiae bacterium]|jgi:multidrug efflux system membrane fusion protein
MHPAAARILPQGQFMKERGRLVRVFRLDGFGRTRRPGSTPDLHELALALGLLLAATASLSTGCSRGQEKATPAGGKGMPVAVTVAVALQKDVPIELQAIGAVHAYASVSVKPRVDGQLGQVGFKQGDDVKQGDLIFQIEPRAFEVALKQAEAVLARDVASLQNAEADMRRTDELANTKAVSASVVDVNRAKVASLRATVEADKAAVEIATVQLSYCSIHSPINGRAGLLLVDVGNVIKNNDTILAVINQTRPIYADFAVPQQSLQEVREAMAGHKLRVEATLSKSAKHRAVGELEVVNNQVDTTTGTVLLRAVFQNEDELLWPGQFLNLALTLGELNGATVVPSAAVQSSQSGEFVFVVKSDETVEKRPVTLGPVRGAETVIQTGVKPGETVVTDGQLRLVPGSKVKAKSRESAPQGKPAEGRGS